MSHRPSNIMRNQFLPANFYGSWQSVALICASALVLVAIRMDFPANLSSEGCDDAYITYRYARNIADGHGFVFNPGTSPILGTSTPLYTLLLACAGLFGFDIPQASQLLGMAGTAATASILVWMGLRSGYTAAGIASGVIWASSPFAFAVSSGMETPVYVALSVAALLAASSRYDALALTLGAFATLMRLDGLAVVGAIVATGMFRRRRISWSAGALPMLIFGAWAFYAVTTFGSVLPASGLAKMSHIADISGRFRVWSPALLNLAEPWVARWSIGAGDKLGSGLTIAALAVSLITAAAVARQTVLAALLAGWIACYLAGFTLLRLPDFGWYYVPPAVGMTLLLAITVESTLRRWLPRRAGLVTTLAGCVAAVVAWGSASLMGAEGSPSAHLQAGRWLQTHASPSSTLAAYEVGKVAYVSALRTTDLLGLTDPGARRFLERGDYAWAIREMSPDYVFTNGPENWPVTDAIFALPEFTVGYELVASFPFRTNLDYRIYAKRRE